MKLIFRKINIDRQELFLHVVFWIAWVLSFTIVQSFASGFGKILMWFSYYVVTLPIFVIHTYIVAYWLLPETFFKKRYLLFGLGVLVLLIVFSVVELLVSHEIIFALFNQNDRDLTVYLNFKNIIISGVGNHYIILVFLAIKAGRDWYKAQNIKDKLVLTKRETDLEIYRYQLQPQLIYTLIDELEVISEQDEEKAPDMIVKISNFLNHFLNEGKEEFISLQLEVKLMEEFLEIHKHALGERLLSNFIVNGFIKSFVVTPLLLLPFINNAIKLAYECNISFESTVIIKAEKKYVLFTFTFWSNESFHLSEAHIIEITKKRLNFSYPGKHRLIENVDENFREVSLELFY